MSMDSDPQIFMAADKTALRFWYGPSKNNFLTEKLGTAIFDNVLFVEVMTPGSKESAPTLEVERHFAEQAGIPQPRVNAQVYERYRPQIDAFKANSEEGKLDGTPIQQWPAIDAGQSATLRAANIFTVEQFAQLPDSALGIVGMGGQMLRERARAFVNAKSFGGNAELLAQVSEMQRTIDAQAEQIRALQSQGADVVPVQSPTSPEPLAAPAEGGLSAVI